MRKVTFLSSLIIIAGLVILGLALASCGGSKPEPPKEPAVQEPQPAPEPEPAPEPAVEEPQIIDMPAMAVVGMELKTTMANDQHKTDIKALMDKIKAEAVLDKITNKAKPNVTLGVITDYDMATGAFTFTYGCEVMDTSSVPGGMVVKEIPAAKYAMFKVKGMIPDDVAAKWRYITSEWLPTANFLATGTAQFEWYDERAADPANAEVDIYFPVVEKPTEAAAPGTSSGPSLSNGPADTTETESTEGGE